MGSMLENESLLAQRDLQGSLYSYRSILNGLQAQGVGIMSRQTVYWLEDSEGNQVGFSTLSHQHILNAQKIMLEEKGIETTIKMERFR